MSQKLRVRGYAIVNDYNEFSHGSEGEFLIYPNEKSAKFCIELLKPLKRRIVKVEVKEDG